MIIFLQLSEQLTSLGNLLKQLNNGQYTQQIPSLGNATIGGHSRHIIELLKCVMDGYEAGTTDYLNRTRDLSIENDLAKALHEIDLLKHQINRADKPLRLITCSPESNDQNLVTSTFYREIVYNTEHAIHHLAFIKVALREMNLSLVHENFGMAYATINYLSTDKKA